MAENIKQRWEGGTLVFYEEPGANRTTTGHPIVSISPTEVKIGSADSDVDLRVLLGSGSKYVLFDAGSSAVTIAGVSVAISPELTVTSTNPAASIEVIDAALIAGGTYNYTGTSLKAVKGNVEVSTTGAYLGNAYGGWFGLKFTSGSGMERQGLAVGLYAEAHTQRTENAQPNAVAYFQSVVSGAGIMTNSPILVLTSTGGSNSDKSKYAIEFGHAPASTTVGTASSGTAVMYRTSVTAANAYANFTEAIQVKVNGNDRWLLLSTSLT